MKKLILLSVIASVMPLASLAQDDDDMYFVPTKANVAKSAAEYGIPQNTYYSGSQRSVDDYNRRGSQFVPIDSAGNDIIDFSAEQGVYPDSLYDESADFQYARRMSRFDDYNWSDPYWAGYYAGRSSRWYSPWYYDSWYDPWYYGYGYGYGYYGWYSPWYYNSWYSPYYYGYYGGRPYYASRSVYRRGNGTLNHIRYSNGNNNYRGGLRTGSFGGSRMQTGTFGTTTRRSSTSGFGGSRSSFDNSSSTRSYSSPNRSTGSFNNNSSTGSSSSFGGSRSSGSFGGSSSGGSFGGSRSAGGFGGRR